MKEEQIFPKKLFVLDFLDTPAFLVKTTAAFNFTKAWCVPHTSQTHFKKKIAAVGLSVGRSVGRRSFWKYRLSAGKCCARTIPRN
jgi:hypothetical protein